MKFPNLLRLAIVADVGLGPFLTNSSNKGTLQITEGLELKFLQALSGALNTTYNIRAAPDNAWGRCLGNGSWNGLIGMVARNEVDIAIGRIGMTYEKSTVVDFSYPYAMGRVTFATAPPGALSKEMAMLYPFTKELWLVVFLTSVLIVFVFRFIFHGQLKYGNIIWYIFGTLLRSSVTLKGRKLSKNSFICAWLLSAMVLSYSYTNTLLSFLTLPLKEERVSDISHLLDVVHEGTYKCYAGRRLPALKFFALSQNERLRSLPKLIEKNDWYIPAYGDNFVRILKQPKTCAIAQHSFLGNLPTEKNLSPDYFYFLLYGIAVNKNFCCKGAIDTFVHRCAAAGLYTKIYNDYMFRMHLKEEKDISHENSFSPLKIQDLSGAFIVIITGYILSCISLIAELIIRRIKKNCL